MKYAAPVTVEEAQHLLASDEEAQVFAGATDLIPQIRAGRKQPPLTVDLKRIPRLVNMRVEGNTWVIGAAVSAAQLSSNPDLAVDFPGMTEAAALIGSDQIQSRATLGGNLCNASPAADTVPAMIVNGAVGVIATSEGTRMVPVSDIAIGPGSTCLAPGEFLLELLVERPPLRTADAYLRFIPRTEMDIAVVGAAARVTLAEDGVVESSRIAIGAVAPTVLRVDEAEAALAGRVIDDDLLDEIATAASERGSPITDKRGTADFRRHVVGVLTKRVVAAAAQRAGGSQ